LTGLDETTIREMLAFIVTESGKMKSEEGTHDDCVMSLASQPRGFTTASFSQSLSPMSFTPKHFKGINGIYKALSDEELGTVVDQKAAEAVGWFNSKLS
jgi:hypothetical protein